MVHEILSSLATLCLTCVTQLPGGGPLTTCDSLAATRTQIITGEAHVSVSYLKNKVVGVDGIIHIQAPVRDVWSVLTDYEHIKDFIPQVLESQLLKDKGAEKLIQQTGKTGILFFKKTSTIVLKVKEFYLDRILFKQDSGDFKVFEGEWQLTACPEGDGTMLAYRAKIKPDFFAPPALTRYVEERDLPKVLQAVRNQAESLQLIGSE